MDIYITKLRACTKRKCFFKLWYCSKGPPNTVVASLPSIQSYMQLEFVVYYHVLRDSCIKLALSEMKDINLNRASKVTSLGH